jgi:hypothetical protein
MNLKSINLFFVTMLLVFLLITCHEDNFMKINSPDGIISVKLNLINQGTPEYDIYFTGKPVIQHSHLGLIREDADFSKDLKLTSTSTTEKVEDSYTLLHGKKSKSAYQANRKVFHFKNKSGDEIDIIFQVSNDGLAFRYYFPGESAEIKKITNELTTFNFSDSAQAWIQPMSVAKSGWNSVNPSYEEHYLQEIKVSDLPNHEPGWVFPALFKSGACWISLTESAPDRNYCGCRLTHDSLSTSLKIGFPPAVENFPGGGVNPESKLPWYTPWRILTISAELGTLVESTLGTDLAKPCVLDDISYVKPGRSSWSWVLLKDDSTIYPVQKRFIDYAADMGWEYCLIDADWDRKIGYEKMAELCSYAKTKNVGIIAWYNSAGSWNTTPYTPRDKLLTKELRDNEFKKLREMGVKAIKVDFFGADGQSMMVYYQDIIEDAARFKLLVNCHGATIPRGWQRTYPNLLSMESVRGGEYLTFDQLNCDLEAGHCAVIPFTRNLFDPMDFTPVFFSEIPNMQRKTSNAFELALSVLFLSGIQHYAEVPTGMAKVPAEIKQILKDVPVAWDETRFVSGYPGKHVVIARRTGKTWYVAGINGEAIEKNLEVNLGFIGRPAAVSGLLISSGSDSRSFTIKYELPDLTRPLSINLKSNDGFLYRFVVD